MKLPWCVERNAELTKRHSVHTAVTTTSATVTMTTATEGKDRKVKHSGNV